MKGRVSSKKRSALQFGKILSLSLRHQIQERPKKQFWHNFLVISEFSSVIFIIANAMLAHKFKILLIFWLF